MSFCFLDRAARARTIHPGRGGRVTIPNPVARGPRRELPERPVRARHRQLPQRVGLALGRHLIALRRALHHLLPVFVLDGAIHGPVVDVHAHGDAEVGSDLVLHLVAARVPAVYPRAHQQRRRAAAVVLRALELLRRRGHARADWIGGVIGGGAFRDDDAGGLRAPVDVQPQL